MKETWLFSSHLFQGNPKYLFLYIHKYKKNIDSYWIAETVEQKKFIKSLGLASYYKKDNEAFELYSKASKYIVENYREWIPYSLNKSATIVNLWHGVGIKNVELGIGPDSYLSKKIISKWIRHNEKYNKNTIFNVTSRFMESHFKEDLNITEDKIIRGGYPRNILCNEPEFKTFDTNEELGLELKKYSKVILFAPTYREKQEHSIFKNIIEIADRLIEIAKKKNILIILKSHPLEQLDIHKDIYDKKTNSKNLLIWPNQLDIYEIFCHVDLAILDYSSIMYDLLNTGVTEIIRFVPDLSEHQLTTKLKFDFLENTVGNIAKDNEELIKLIENDQNKVSGKHLERKFFEYHDYNNNKHNEIEKIIDQIKLFNVESNKTKTLYSFDIFDTLIERKYVTPESIFFATQDEIKKTNIGLTKDFIDNYVDIRKNTELDIRETFKRTNFERQTNKIEIKISDIFYQIADIYQLTKKQTHELINLEKEIEITHSKPIKSYINIVLSFLKQKDKNDVILISDMYLDKLTISKMLAKAEPSLAEIPIYLSSEIGYQKSNGSLYKNIFYNINYNYKKWVHFGDNYQADHEAAKELSISPRHHIKNEFSCFESNFLESNKTLEGFKIASLWNSKKNKLINKSSYSFSDEEYYTYVYAAPLIVPYVAWLIDDAIVKGYKTIYFISRDGIFLKKIADIIIKEKKATIKTKLIYGSRKAWRLSGQVNGIDDFSFTRLGLFTNEISRFSELIKNSYLERDELISIEPKLRVYEKKEKLSNNDLERIRYILSKNNKYREILISKADQECFLAKKYLVKNIDFTEKFCFAEYSGRGYTQNCLDKILKSTNQHLTSTDFYYIKSYYSSDGNCIRYKYITSKNYFAFVEPIFSATPIKSVTKYIIKNGVVVPHIRKNRNSTYKTIKKGLLDFTNDYISENLLSKHYFGRVLTNYMADYHIKNPADYFIYKVYSSLNNHSQDHDSLHLTACPAFTIENIKQKDIESLRKKTNNMRLSLLNSSDEVKKLFFEKFDVKIQPQEVNGIKNKFPEADFSKVVKISLHEVLIAVKTIKIYSSILMIEENETIYHFNSGDIVEVIEVIWDPSGTPFLLTKPGFIEAKLENFKHQAKIKSYICNSEKKLLLV